MSSWLDPPDSTTTAATYQVNAAHTGAQPRDTLTLPLVERWSFDFGTPELSYPLIAQGRVYIVAGGDLYALDLASGRVVWGPRALGDPQDWSHPAYERGRIFTVETGSHVRALSAATGDEIWSVELHDYWHNDGFRKSIPAVHDGYLYFAGYHKFFAVDGETGTVKWRLTTDSCPTSGAAVGSAGAFVACACGHVYAADPRTGQQRWAYPGGCAGGGGGVPVLLAGDFLYTRDSTGNLVFDAVTGEAVGFHTAGPIPAASGDFLYSVSDGSLVAYHKGSVEAAWRFGNGRLTIAPLVVGQHVVVGSAEGDLSVLDARTGDLISEIKLPKGLQLPNEAWDSEPFCTGLNAAEDRLVVPNGTEIRVY